MAERDAQVSQALVTELWVQLMLLGVTHSSQDDSGPLQPSLWFLLDVMVGVAQKNTSLVGRIWPAPIVMALMHAAIGSPLTHAARHPMLLALMTVLQFPGLRFDAVDARKIWPQLLTLTTAFYEAETKTV
jgi:hypothetical protein